MISEKAARKWQFMQMIMQFVILISFSISILVKMNVKRQFSLLALCLFLILLIISQFSLFENREDQGLKLLLINHYLQTINIIFTLSATFMFGTALFVQLFGTKFVHWWLLVAICYQLVMFIPMAKLALGKVSSLIGRIVLLIFAYFAIAIGSVVLFIPVYRLDLSNVQLLFAIAGNGFTGIIAASITSLVAMRDWHFATPHIKLGSKVNVFIVCGIIAFACWDCLFNAFNTTDSWRNFLTSWHFAVIWPHDPKFVLTGLQAGIGEEWLMRFCILSLLLNAFQKSSHQILWSVLLESTIFGLLHFTNLFAQPVSATFEQILSAISSGLIFSAIYLYTNSILISIIYHALFDILAFISSGSLAMMAPNAYDLQVAIFFFFLYSAIAAFLLTGKRQEVVKANLAQNSSLTANLSNSMQ